MRSPFLFKLIIPLFLFACEKDQMGDCLKSSGPRVHQTRDFQGIRVVELNDHVELAIEKSQDEGVEVQAGKKLLPLIETEKRGDSLFIRDRNTCDWVRSYENIPKVTVRTKKLQGLVNRGTADIQIKGSIEAKDFLYTQWNGMGNVNLSLSTDRAELKLHTGAGQLSCNGESNFVYAYSAGFGSLDLENLKAQRAFAWNKGSGDMHLQVQDELRAKLEGLGSIFYEGDGELVDSIDQGDGRIERRE